MGPETAENVCPAGTSPVAAGESVTAVSGIGVKEDAPGCWANRSADTFSTVPDRLRGKLLRKLAAIPVIVAAEGRGNEKALASCPGASSAVSGEGICTKLPKPRKQGWPASPEEPVVRLTVPPEANGITETDAGRTKFSTWFGDPVVSMTAAVCPTVVVPIVMVSAAPAAPVEPVEPVGPCGPVGPVAPVGPAGPCTP